MGPGRFRATYSRAYTRAVALAASDELSVRPSDAVWRWGTGVFFLGCGGVCVLAAGIATLTRARG